MDIIFTITIILLISFLSTIIAKKIKIPSVVALILTGLILGAPYIREKIIGTNGPLIFILGDIGLVSLMFLAGLESSWKILNSEKIDSMYIAFFAATLPFLLGTVTFRLLGFSWVASLIVGIAMSITAEATKARVLLEIKKLRTRVGAAMMGAGIIDDILGLILFILVTTIFKDVQLKEDFLIIFAIAAFFTGVVIPTNAIEKKSWAKHIENTFIWTIVPFFFISIGIHFKLSSLILNPILLILILTIAMAGKIVGALLTKPFVKFKIRQLLLIGWGMNSRGAIELALALLALRTKLIPIELYSSLVIMALTTTLIFPFVIIKMIKKTPRIMD